MKTLLFHIIYLFKCILLPIIDNHTHLLELFSCSWSCTLGKRYSIFKSWNSFAMAVNCKLKENIYDAREHLNNIIMQHQSFVTRPPSHPEHGRRIVVEIGFVFTFALSPWCRRNVGDLIYLCKHGSADCRGGLPLFYQLSVPTVWG